MKEDLLYYIWEYKIFFTSELKTSEGELIQVLSVGNLNQNSGPDFFNAQLRIGEQLWAGNVEIHLKSSDWYIHKHEKDHNYDNVILHVVWSHDVEIYNSENSIIPTLELKSYVSPEIVSKYQKLFSKTQKWINCENDIQSIDDFTLKNWFERLYFERLERKSNLINNLLEKTNHDWEAVLFQLLSRNFGLKVNADVFFEMASSLDFSIVRKEAKNLESLLFGELGILNKSIDNTYYNHLKKEYQYQKNKYKLSNNNHLSVQYFRLRPMNFPTIRISQLSSLYGLHQNLFSKLMTIQSIKDFYDLFTVATSDFWERHYTFEKESPKRIKKISKPFIDLLLINTIIPLKFVYLKHLGKLEESKIIELLEQINPERNSIIDKFTSHKIISKNAFETQALLELKNEYCTPQKCLQCAIGNYLLK